MDYLYLFKTDNVLDAWEWMHTSLKTIVTRFDISEIYSGNKGTASINVSDV